MKLLLIIIAISSCRCAAPQEPTAPQVQIVADDPNDIDAARYVVAAQAWAPLDFTFSNDQLAGYECDPLWYVEDQAGCQLTIHVIRDEHTVDKFGANGYTIGRTIWITTLVGSTYEMRRIMAHETGHAILNTSKHTLGGIMGGSSWVMQQPDFDLACESIGICKEPQP